MVPVGGTARPVPPAWGFEEGTSYPYLVPSEEEAAGGTPELCVFPDAGVRGGGTSRPYPCPSEEDPGCEKALGGTALRPWSGAASPRP